MSTSELIASKKMSFATILLLVLINSIPSNCDINLNKTSSENHTSSLLSCDDEHCEQIVRDQMVLVQKLDDYIKHQSSSLKFSAEIDRLKHSSIIYALILIAEENQLNQQCYNEIMQIYDGINRKEIWAMKSEFRYFVVFFLVTFIYYDKMFEIE
jgi:hypothetical protein